MKPLKQELDQDVKKIIKKKFRAAVLKFIKIYRSQRDKVPNALLALQEIMRERRRRHRELLQLQRKNTIMYLYEKSPLCIGESPFGPNGNGGKDFPLDYGQQSMMPAIPNFLSGMGNTQSYQNVNPKDLKQS